MPVDQACGLQAVGYSTGYLVSSRSYSREDQLSASAAIRAAYSFGRDRALFCCSRPCSIRVSVGRHPACQRRLRTVDRSPTTRPCVYGLLGSTPL